MRRYAVLLGIVLSASASCQGAVEALRAVRTVDLRAYDPWMAPDPFAALGPGSGDELIRLLPLVRRQETLYAVATTLRRLKRRDSLPALIRRLDWSAMDYRFSAAYRALSEWSWEAIGPLTRGLTSPNRRVRLNCAGLLTLQCPQQRYVKLPPLRPLML